MFINDDSPERVIATPAATAHLRTLVARDGELAVLLDDHAVHVIPRQSVPRGSVQLGHVDDSLAFAAATTRTPWWRNRAVIDLTDPSGSTTAPAGPDSEFGFALTALSESELYAAVAAGPLPRC
jgi:hypothetical protein